MRNKVEQEFTHHVVDEEDSVSNRAQLARVLEALDAIKDDHANDRDLLNQNISHLELQNKHLLDHITDLKRSLRHLQQPQDENTTGEATLLSAHSL